MGSGLPRHEKTRTSIAFHERNLRTSVLSLLRKEGGLPRTLLGKRLNTTPAMITRCVQRMRSEGLLQEKGRSLGTGGRTLTNIALNPEVGVVIGVEYGREGVSTLILDFAGQRESIRSFPLPANAHDGTPEALLSAVFEAIREAFSGVTPKRPLLGIAAVDPGVVDTLTGVTVSANNLPEWKQVPVQRRLAETFGVPVHTSNTGNAILAAIDRLELKRDCKDLLYIEYREGIACAIKSNGKQVLGSHGMAGELTWYHANSVVEQTEGRPMFLEKVFGFSGIRQQLHDNRHPLFLETTPVADSAHTILRLAAEGDEQVQQILHDSWYSLGRVCGGIANLLDPEVVVLDPHFGQADTASLDALKHGIRYELVAPHADQIEIMVSKLPEPTAPLGAALSLLDELTFSGDLV